MPLLTASQRTPEWQAARRGRVTASVAAACLGLDKHHGPYWAYQEILGNHKEGRPNPAMQYGIDHEAEALAAYELRSGNLALTTGFWVHPDLPWLGASPDALAGTDGMLELKCPGNTPESLPEWHRVQMQVGLACTGRAWCDYLAWVHDQPGLLCRVERDLEQEARLLDGLSEFYRRHVLAKEPPPRRKKKETSELL